MRENNRNKKGQTPLMEAALWGRAENVGILLAAGADKDMKDREGRRAIDFTTQSEENKEERYVRSGGEYQFYNEDSYDADGQWSAID